MPSSLGRPRRLPERRGDRRRPAFLSEPASFFYEDDRPRSAEEFADPFRRGLLLTARATTEAELAWLRATLAELELLTG